MAYPEGYRDPDWDGSEADFAARVIPARADAIASKLSTLLPEGLSFSVAEADLWESPADPIAVMRDLMERMGAPRPPRTLVMHPTAARALDDHVAATVDAGVRPGTMTSAFGIPVTEDDTLADGAWELREGGNVIRSGIIRTGLEHEGRLVPQPLLDDLRFAWEPANDVWGTPTEWDEFAEQWRRTYAGFSRKHGPRLLTPLPRRVRLRLWLGRRVDAAAIWLAYHRCGPAAIALWRATGRW